MEKRDQNAARSIKVCLTGPECTGKSTLAAVLAAHYHTVWVPEFARSYIDQLDRPYRQSDLPIIAQGQVEAEKRLMKVANDVLICDTDMTVMKIWCEHKYGSCDPSILALYQTNTYDLHLLTGTDVPWEEDPQRENSALRTFFYTTFKRELTLRGAHFIEVSGSLKERTDYAIAAIDALLRVF